MSLYGSLIRVIDRNLLTWTKNVDKTDLFGIIFDLAIIYSYPASASVIIVLL